MAWMLGGDDSQFRLLSSHRLLPPASDRRRAYMSPEAVRQCKSNWRMRLDCPIAASLLRWPFAGSACRRPAVAGIPAGFCLGGKELLGSSRHPHLFRKELSADVTPLMRFGVHFLHRVHQEIEDVTYARIILFIPPKAVR